MALHKEKTEVESSEESHDVYEEESVDFKQDKDSYIIDGSDTRYIDRSELAELSADDCRLARNKIYARHGRAFSDEVLQEYFNEKDWYTSSVAPEDFQDSMLNEYEIYNRDMIVEYEKEMGYR